MRWLGNLFHLLTGGFILASAWLVAAFLVFPFRETRQLAGPCLQLAIFHLWTGGKTLVRDSRMEAYRAYVRTGRFSEQPRGITWPEKNLRAQILLWAPLGLVLAAGHLLHGFLSATIRLSPLRLSPSFSLLPACLFPLGFRVAQTCDARSRFVLASRKGPGKPGRRSSIEARESAFWRLKPVSIGAAVVLWATMSANEPSLITQAAPLDGRSAMAVSTERAGGIVTATAGQITRPIAMPPLPVGILALATEKAFSCEAAVIRASVPSLSRRHLTFALPLGSTQVALGQGDPASRHLHYLAKLDQLAASRKNARISKQPCSRLVAGHAIRSAGYVADRAAFFRLAGKAGPEPSRYQGRSAQPALNSALQHRRIVKVQRLLASMSPAKAPNNGGIEEIAARIARVGSIR